MADAAGDILRRHFRSPLMVDVKDDNSPVTRADREVETALRAIIEANFPEHGIVGEEFGSVRPQAEYQWVIDPIDGTRGFICGYPLFTTLIALLHKGVPVLGVIDQPITKERWVGARGESSELNMRVIQTRDCRLLKEAVLATTSTDYFTPQQAERVAHLRAQCANSALGGDAYAYAMLASGNVDIVLDAGTKPYDFCALVPVVEGAGGVITDWQGRPLSLKSDGSVLAAASKELHAFTLSVLQAG